MFRGLSCTVNMDMMMMYQEATKQNWDFTAAIKHVVISLERMRILILSTCKKESPPCFSRVRGIKVHLTEEIFFEEADNDMFTSQFSVSASI